MAGSRGPTADPQTGVNRCPQCGNRVGRYHHADCGYYPQIVGKETRPARYGEEALYDPVTNTAVARAVLDYRDRWSGKGGWTCADLLEIW